MRPSVWAPRAEVVDVVLVDGTRHRLVRGGDGWHTGGPELASGTEYRFSLDGADPLPDPRSHSQPDGIEGASAVVEHGLFPWTDHGWRGFHLPGAVLYELHVGTFTEEGTFDAAIGRLDHLVDLGVDAVEVMPVAEAMGERGWGYDGVLLFAPHHAYGGPDGFKRFVDACHARGVGVVLDVVYNHLGPKGNHLERFGPYFTEAHHTPWGAAVNLDGPGSDEVRRFVLDNAAHWFADHHVDGLRLDATHALLDDSPTHLLAELAASVRALSAHVRRPLWLVAEDERDDPRLVTELALDGRWADDLHHVLHVAVTGEAQGYYGKFSPRPLERLASTAALRPDDVPAHHYVVCTQNHDQVGNRAVGDRLSHVAGVDAQLAVAALVLCSPATPMLFMGEEWAASTPFPYFVDVPDDPELAAAIRDGRRREFADFGWAPEAVPDPTDPKTAAAAVLRWDELDDEPHARVLAWYRDLVALRRARADLTDDRRDRTSVAVDGDVVVLRRAATAVAANLGTTAAATATVAGTTRLLLASRDGVAVRTGGAVDLPPLSAAVVALD